MHLVGDLVASIDPNQRHFVVNTLPFDCVCLEPEMSVLK
jgi:hypothetical protein